MTSVRALGRTTGFVVFGETFCWQEIVQIDDVAIRVSTSQGGVMLSFQEHENYIAERFYCREHARWWAAHRML